MNEQTQQTEQTNTFQQMEQEQMQKDNPGVVIESEQQTTEDVSANDFSDVAVGDKKRYERPNLNEKVVKVLALKIMKPNINQELPEESKNKKSKYWKVPMKILYDSNNADGIQDREFISGARMFQQRDGGASEISFWYPGSKTQSAYLWELCAKAKGKNPEDISPREFFSFWNNVPTVKLGRKEYDNFTSQPGAPDKIEKNMPVEFIN